MSKVNVEPVAVSAAVVAVLNALVLLGVVSLTPDQVAAINAAVAAVLALIVRQRVTPTAKYGTLVDPAP
jgi:hypothetical protein